MFIVILILLVLALIGLLTYVAKQSPEMVITREIFIKAKPEVLFPHINNSKKSNEWMPWMESDPHVKMIYSGPEEGLGSTSSWDSIGRMGKGNAVVIESLPNKLVRTQLTYTRPMEMSQVAEITLSPSEDGTIVCWSVTGKNNFVGRLFCLFMNMDKMVGGQFEKGLGKLKNKIES